MTPPGQTPKSVGAPPSASDARHRRMTEGPVDRLILRLAGPSIAIMLISAAYNIADTYFVGRLGTSQTAAIGVVFPFMSIIQGFGFFFGQGAGNFLSRLLGARDDACARRVAATGFFSSVSMGTIIAVIGLWNIDGLAHLLGATPTILPHARDYLFFVALAAPFFAGSLALNNLLRFQGNAFFGMIGMGSGAILNIALDPLFIFGLDLGVKGASLATFISQAASCAILFMGCRRPGNIPVRLMHFTPAWSVCSHIIRGGAPSLLRQGLASVAMIFLVRLASGYEDEAIAAISIVQRVMMVAFAALVGFGQGFQPVCGFNYGAGRFERVRRAFWFCSKTSVWFLVILACGAALFAESIVSVFRNDPEVIVIGARALRWHCITLPLMGWVVPVNMMLQTIGKAVKASLLEGVRQGLFFLPFIFLLEGLWGWEGLIMAAPAAELATFCLSAPIGRGVLAELIRDGNG